MEASKVSAAALETRRQAAERTVRPGQKHEKAKYNTHLSNRSVTNDYTFDGLHGSGSFFKRSGLVSNQTTGI